MNIWSPYLGKEDMKDIRNIARKEQFSNRRKIYDFKVVKYERNYQQVIVSFYTKGKVFHEERYGIFGECWRFMYAIK